MMAEVERVHVHKVYSQIAEHFSDTRYKPWPRIAQFLREQPPGSLVADVGCGNGKYLGVNPQTYMLGSDICPELVAIAQNRGYEVAVCDCLNLPYRSDQFDAVICIAVIHHLSSEERRVSALRELARVVRPGGTMLVYVWAMEQQRKKFSSQDVMVPWHRKPEYAGHPQQQQQQRQPTRPKESKPKQKKKRKKERKVWDEESAPKHADLLELEANSSEDMPGLCEFLGLRLSDDEDSRGNNTATAKEGQGRDSENQDLTEGKEINFGSPTTTFLRSDSIEVSSLQAQGSSSVSNQLATESLGVSNQLPTESLSVSNQLPTESLSVSDQLPTESLGVSNQLPTESLGVSDQLPTESLCSDTCHRSGHEEKTEAGTSPHTPHLPTTPSQPGLAGQGYRTFQRYYHVFKRGELAQLFTHVTGVVAIEEFYDHENWCVLAEKLSAQ